MKNVAQVLLGSLDQCWQKYLRELRRCKKSPSEDSVHDLRVATRRLVSTLMIFELVLPDADIRKLRRRLKRLFDALSPLRDVQVQLHTIEKNVAGYPDLESLLTVLKVRERILLKAIDGRIRKIPTYEWSRTISHIKRETRLEFSGRAAHEVGMSAAKGGTATAFARALFRKKQIVTTRPRSIHRFRVAFKKFRYNVEAMEPLLAGISRKRLKAMDAYQTRMGNIQDLELLSRRVRRFAASKPFAVRRRLSAYQRGIQQEKKELTARFLRSLNEFYGFWKKTSHRF